MTGASDRRVLSGLSALGMRPREDVVLAGYPWEHARIFIGGPTVPFPVGVAFVMLPAAAHDEKDPGGHRVLREAPGFGSSALRHSSGNHS